jgi:integrase
MEARSASNSLTVAELFERYCADYTNPKCKDIAAYRRRTNYQLQRVMKIAPQIARLRSAALTASDIAKLREILSKHLAAGTVRTTLIPISAALAWAVREGLLERNPAVGVQRPPAPAPKLDFLSADEVRRLLAEAEHRAKTATGKKRLVWWSRWVAICIGVHTGARKGEIFGLRWTELDLERQRLTISRSYATTPKSGKTRHLRLPSALVPLLRAWKEQCPSPLVCPVVHRGTWGMSRDTSCEHALPELLTAAGCRNLPRPWHLLRHSFASHFMQSGGNLLALSQILGHTDVKVTMIYAHLSSDFLDGQMEKVKF